MGKRRATFGAVTEMRRGVWRIRWWADTPEGRRRCSETVYGTRRDADRRLAEIRLEKEGEKSPTVGEIWTREVRPFILEDIKHGRKSKQTLVLYDAVWKRSVEPRWGGMPVSQVRSAYIQDWLLTLKKSEGGTAKVVLSLVTQRALMMDYIVTDPCKVRFRYADAGRKNSEGVWDLETMDRAWGVVRGTFLELPFLMCGHAGLRVGEAFGLQVGDLEFAGERLLIHVERAWSNAGEVAPLKTKTSKRTAVMEQPYAGRVAELVAEGNGTWLMDDGTGTPAPRGLANSAWRKAFKKWGGPYITMSRLRNSYETYMHWQRGVSQQSLSKILGHASIDTTKQYYDLPDNEKVVNSFISELDSKKEVL